MLFSNATFIGVDTSGGRKPFTFAALDADCNLIALGDGDMADALTFVSGNHAVCVAINAPARPNRGLLKKGEQLNLLNSAQLPGRAADMRLAEYYLRERGIAVGNTPSREELCPGWMRTGFEFHQKCDELGYKVEAAQLGANSRVETHPHASFCVLLGQTPLSRLTLEGRLQRQLALYDAGLEIKDPMDFFEEITRHRLLKGILPMDVIYPPEVLDALIAAYVAFLTSLQPERLTAIGDKLEGQIILPGELKPKYA